MTCPYLEYRSLADAGEGSSDDADAASPRAYCTAAQSFVQAMRADVCNDRYGLDHETDCEIYRDAEGLPEVPDAEGARSDESPEESDG